MYMIFLGKTHNFLNVHENLRKFVPFLKMVTPKEPPPALVQMGRPVTRSVRFADILLRERQIGLPKPHHVDEVAPSWLHSHSANVPPGGKKKLQGTAAPRVSNHRRRRPLPRAETPEKEPPPSTAQA